MRLINIFLSVTITGCTALADTTQYQTHCGIQFALTVDSTKISHICNLTQKLDQYKNLLKRVGSKGSDPQNPLRVMESNSDGSIYFLPGANKLNPDQLDQILVHELSHLVHYKLIQDNDTLVDEYKSAWQNEGGMMKPGDFVPAGYSSSSVYEGFAEAMRFVVFQDPITNQYPKQKAIIWKILERYY